MKSVREQVLSQMQRGRACSASSFCHLGTPEQVRQALHRLNKSGRIQRLSNGVYAYPKLHPKLGELPPTSGELARAVAAKLGIEIQLNGAAAANVLGISEQVPTKAVYLTNGLSRKIQLSGRTIEFRHVSPRRLVEPGTKVGNVFQTILHLGKHGLSPAIISQLRGQLNERERRKLKAEVARAPAWAQAAIRAIASPSDQQLAPAA